MAIAPFSDPTDNVIGSIRTFGECGPMYEVTSAAPLSDEGDLMISILVIGSGEALDYELEAVLNDPQKPSSPRIPFRYNYARQVGEMTKLPQTDVPIGSIKQFGPYGPEYEVLAEAADEKGRRMARIVLVRTGEELTYPLNAILEDPEAK